MRSGSLHIHLCVCHPGAPADVGCACPLSLSGFCQPLGHHISANLVPPDPPISNKVFTISWREDLHFHGSPGVFAVLRVQLFYKPVIWFKGFMEDLQLSHPP